MKFFRFYPYIMLTSCFFLMVTMIVYSIVPKLLNSYSKLMIHYSTSLMLGLLCMALNHLVKDKLERPKLCSFLGKVTLISNFEHECSKSHKSFWFRIRYSIFLHMFLHLHECNGCWDLAASEVRYWGLTSALKFNSPRFSSQSHGIDIR